MFGMCVYEVAGVIIAIVILSRQTGAMVPPMEQETSDVMRRKPSDAWNEL